MGRRTLTSEVRRGFWSAVVQGSTSEDAAVAAGVAGITGRRWFKQAGGVCPISVSAPSGRYLSLAEREEIALGLAARESIRSIAQRIGRAPSTVSREVRRNSRSGHTRREDRYRAVLAQSYAERRARRPKPTKLASCPRLHTEVDRRLQQRWSPEEIAGRLRLDFPDDEQMRISHETIYRALYVQGRGGLRRELTACLRTGRALRKPRGRKSPGQAEKIPDKIMISDRPAEADDRAVPGHWEGDLIIGARNQSAIGTLVERTTRFTLLLPLPDGYHAEAVRDAIVPAITTLPEHLRRSLAWDQGSEMTKHADLKTQVDLQVYFCDPASPWQRGTNENTNGLLRQYFPKGTPLDVHSPKHLADVEAELNGRPRKTLGWHTPAEALNELLSNPPTTSGVATTP
jgi:IS30 family transposase